MGLRDFFRREKGLTATPAVLSALHNGQLNTYQRLGGSNEEIGAAWQQYQAASYAYIYRSQPAVRKVVDYIARNASQLGLKLYERVSDTDRRRDTDHPAAQTMADPDGQGPPDQFLFTLIADWLVNENAYALIYRSSAGSRRRLLRVPPAAVEILTQGFFIVGYRIWLSNGRQFPDRSQPPLAPEDMLHWCGYNPEDARLGVSRLETLRSILAEDAASQQANIELLKAGLAKPGYIKRPLEAADWPEAVRERFQESWANQAKSSPRKTPVLEEGMEFADFGVSPKDAEMLDGRRFTNEEVASLYGLAHVPPEGEEERRAFYADVLPPLTGALAAQLNFSLLHNEFAEDAYYFEFDLNEKLRGEPEARFAAITSAVGRPWLTANEARAMENRPPVDGGDELVTPLNVLVGDNPRPAPNVMPPQDPNGPAQDGSHREASIKALLAPRQQQQLDRRNRYAREFTDLLVRHYERQERAYKSTSVKADRWVQWNAEMAGDLDALLRKSVETEGDVAAARFGSTFDTRMVTNYLQAMAEGAATDINKTTREELATAEAADVFARAKDVRSVAGGMSLATAASAFANREAAKQSVDAEHRVKTWIVTAADSAHPEMNGETVPLGATFSNGADGPPADHPGCECILEISANALGPLVLLASLWIF